MKRPTVFSLVHNQSVFMTTIMGLLTFISVLALGVALSIGTTVVRWNTQWDLYATVQVMNSANAKAVKTILNNNQNKIDKINEITPEQMRKLMAPWISGGGAAMEKYLPQMYEIKFKTKDDLLSVNTELDDKARFLTHAEALHPSTSAGWKMIFIASLVLALTLCAITICIIYIARNTALLHKRELEILNQIGASDDFVAHQMQIIVARICTIACGLGFILALPVIALILSAAHSARVGMLAQMTIGVGGWTALVLTPVFIVAFAILITKKTTLKILQHE